MLPQEQILPNEYQSQITTNSLIDQPLYIFKISSVYSSLKSDTIICPCSCDADLFCPSPPLVQGRVTHAGSVI